MPRFSTLSLDIDDIELLSNKLNIVKNMDQPTTSEREVFGKILSRTRMNKERNVTSDGRKHH